jgi:hypothetical protein
MNVIFPSPFRCPNSYLPCRIHTTFLYVFNRDGWVKRQSFLTCIREVLVSNFDWDTDCLENFLAFPQSLKADIFGLLSLFWKSNRRLTRSLCCSLSVFYVSCLMTLSVPRLNCFDDRMINDYAAVDGMTIGTGNRSTWRKPVPMPLVYHKSHISWPLIWPMSLQWEPSE